MSVFTNPITRTTGERITQSIWNSDLVENLKYLYDTLVAYILGETLTTINVSAPAASVDIQNIPQTGADLIITGYLLPATDDTLLFLRLNNYSGAADYVWNSIQFADPGSDTADSEIQFNLGSAAYGVGNVSGEGISFKITIPDYTKLVNTQQLFAIYSYVRAGGQLNGGTLLGYLAKNEAISRITLFFSAGNIALGTVRVRTTRAS